MSTETEPTQASSCVTCLTPTSTGGKKHRERTKPSGALSSRQQIALIQSGKWWPFNRADGKVLVEIHRQAVQSDEALL
jgi:hypothetical protein